MMIMKFQNLKKKPRLGIVSKHMGTASGMGRGLGTPAIAFRIFWKIIKKHGILVSTLAQMEFGNVLTK